MKKIKNKVLVIIATLVMLITGTAYFLFNIFDKDEALQEMLPWGLLLVIIIAIAIPVFNRLDKSYQKAIKTN